MNLDDVRTILAQDQRQWARLWDDRFALAEVAFDVTERQAADALKSELEAEGYSAEIVGQVALSIDGLEQIIVWIEKHGEAIRLVLEGFAATGYLIPKAKGLLVRLRGLGRRVDAHPILLLEDVLSWMNARYGSGNWRFDPEAIDVKPIGSIKVLAVTELESGAKHLLVVEGVDAKLTELLPR